MRAHEIAEPTPVEPLFSGPAALGNGPKPDGAKEKQVSRRPKRYQIAIIAEVSIPSCKLYRVDGKADGLRHLGHKVEVVDWSNREACHQAVQLCDLLILYRVGAHSHVLTLLADARRLGVPTLFEVDDLVFDQAVYAIEPSLARRPVWEQRSVLDGVIRYRNSLFRCDHAIVSTEPLAGAVREALPKADRRTFVVENAPSHHMLRLADQILRYPLPRSNGQVVIGYGSGTRTHDADFASIAPALVQVLDRFPATELALHGPLTMPDALRRFGDRVKQFPHLSFDDYLRIVATWDVNLVPLERSVFTEAKSNIKFIEAALVGVPSVCTPTAPFRSIIEQGVNGLLASAPDEWVIALASVLGDADYRREMGARSRATVLDRYHPDRIAANQIRPILDQLLRSTERARVLVLEDAPPAEDERHPAHLLELLGCLDVRTFCIDCRNFGQCTGALPRLERRVDLERDVVSFISSERPDPVQYWNLDVAEGFRKLAEAWQPDIVVVGAIAGLGVSVVHECLNRTIPYVVVLRDEWWLNDPLLSGTEKPGSRDPSADQLRDAAHCSTRPDLVFHRYFELKELLLKAAALVAIDESLQTTYRKHNLPAELLCAGDLGGVIHRVLAA